MRFTYSDLEAHSVNGMRFYETPYKKYYPSITTILGATISEEKQKILNDWKNSIGVENAKQITKDAAESGTAVHLLIERYLKRERLVQHEGEFNDEQINSFNALKLKLNKIDEVWGQEIPLYSDILEVAGRCDCVGVYKGLPSIIDFKTSRRIKSDKDIEDYKLQLCAYSIMHNELYDTDIQTGIILMVSQAGFPQEFKVNLEDYIEPLVERVQRFYKDLYSSL